MASSQQTGQQVIRVEAEALMRLEALIDQSFDKAVSLIVGCKGHIVVTGVGKPWLIGQKISATFASTGTASFALHPSEAMHGDLGRLTPGDVVIALSNSGASEEVIRLLPLLKRDGIAVIGLTGRTDSELARLSDVVLNLGRIEEACPLKLAPSASTTAMLAMGDALAIAVMEARGFTKEDYARFHPGGALGRKLMKVEEVMRPLERTATVKPDASVKEALFAITQKKSGCVFIVNASGVMLGLFTDGDLRRHVEQAHSLLGARIETVMTKPGIRAVRGELAAEAAHVMQMKRIDELPVVDSGGVLVGHLDVQDLLAVGMI